MYKNFSKIYDKFMEICNYEEWIKVLEGYIKNYNPQGKTVLDLGCGTGETLLRIKNDYELSGLDLSEQMLKKANIKLKKKNVKLFLGDMREFNTGETYDIIFSFFDTVNHLTSIEDLMDLFNSVKNSLNEDGIYIFDVVDREFMNKMFSNDVYADNRKDFAVIWEHDYEEENKLDIIEATYFIKNKGNTFERYKEYYEKRIFTQEEITSLAKNCGLTVEFFEKNEELAGVRYFYILKNKK